MLDLPTEALAREARCADLVVVRRAGGSPDPYSALDPGGAILRSAVPCWWCLTAPPRRAPSIS